MSVELWAARLERPLTAQEQERLLGLLPEERRARLLRLQDTEKRREPLCAYQLLRLALWALYRWRDLPEIALSETGKPWFPEHPEVHFSLSHTNGAVLVGVSGGPVGVDIQQCRPLSQRSLRRLAAGETEQVFYQGWVRREARTKRTGEGIGAMLRTEPPLREGERYDALDTFPGYAAGVAACGDETPGELRKYSLDALLSAAGAY